MTLTLAGASLKLELNGQPVYRHAVDPGNSRRFGVYHDKKRTAAKVREVVLRGRWPSAFPDKLAGGTAAQPAGAAQSEADRRARHELVGEDFLTLDAAGVALRARRLDPAKRYDALAAWVLPSDDHPVFRLQGGFTPSFRADSTRGGELVAPALDLVETAAHLHKLDELAARVDAEKAGNDVDRRGKLALQALIQAAGGDEPKATASLKELKPFLDKAPAALPTWARWPEVAAASGTLGLALGPERPGLRAPALALLETVVEQAATSAPGTPWAVLVKGLRARALRLPESAVAARSDSAAAPWVAVSRATARSRGTGLSPAVWSGHDGAFTHEAGHADDYLLLTAPLRGDFTVDCELTAAPGRVGHLVYGGVGVGMKRDGKMVERLGPGQPPVESALNPPPKTTGGWVRCRLEVKGPSVIALLDGRQVFATAVRAGGDPWLAFHCAAAEAGAIRGLKISGRPTVPQTLDLSGSSELTGWFADEYGEALSGDTPDWTAVAGEILGRHRNDFPGGKLESVLRYHRPLLEDGEVAWEFYYEPGEVLTHPALGRLVFLLEPEGVRTHVLTDAQYERTGLTADNTADEPQNRRGPASPPLKPTAWNKAALSLTGNRVALRLNGELVYEQSLEPAVPRQFGFFHYADATAARVRSVTYSGRWPTALPVHVSDSAGGHGRDDGQHAR
jgi:hypothetical protein